MYLNIYFIFHNLVCPSKMAHFDAARVFISYFFKIPLAWATGGLLPCAHHGYPLNLSVFIHSNDIEITLGWGMLHPPVDFYEPADLLNGHQPLTQSAVGQPLYFRSEWLNTRGSTK